MSHGILDLDALNHILSIKIIFLTLKQFYSHKIIFAKRHSHLVTREKNTLIQMNSGELKTIKYVLFLLSII